MEAMRSTMDLLQRNGYLAANDGGCILDVGANLGMICIPLVQQHYFERAIAFEPAPDTYRLLVKNVLQNHLEERITCIPSALSSTSGTFEMELSDSNSGDHRMRHNAKAGAYREEQRKTIRVPTQTLDDFFAEHPEINREEVRVIWMDIQGHEGRFFEGARRSLHQGMAIVSEFWPYAIERSGMSHTDYIHVVTNLFTHFYEMTTGQKRPIAEISGLFERFSGPRQMCTIILVRNP